MSMEIYVLSDRKLSSMSEWQSAIDSEGFPLRLSAAMPLGTIHGALPVTLHDRSSAFECDHRDAKTVISETPDVSFGRPWRYAIVFRWGGDIDAGVSAYLAAAAYAAATGGRVLDCAEGKLVSPAQAAKTATELDQGRALIAEAVRRATEMFRKP
ncbi:hypothetical protein LPW26_03680 [Rhodopseudomonas sp. HC1]|uniref:hypothetical protein n=1 Tax=Rhodopseudomonas infernalis TaxID=2897386 RepID=UPI001EE8A4F8|nr:hypothetical protein [Rhodopseudomonas infernalis]MCG6203726.1 hypothetical protein [Rhodopseudomonas infernalis]